MEASHKKHRPHIKVGQDAEEEEEVYCACKNNRIKHLRRIRACVCVLNGNIIMSKGSRGVTHAGGPISTVSIRVLDMDAISDQSDVRING